MQKIKIIDVLTDTLEYLRRDEAIAERRRMREKELGNTDAVTKYNRRLNRIRKLILPVEMVLNGLGAPV